MNNFRIRLEFKGSCLKQENKAAYTPKNVVNIFIIYELDSQSRDLGTDFTLGSCLFGGVKLLKYSYSGYGIGFDTRGEYSLPDVSVSKMLLFLELI